MEKKYRKNSRKIQPNKKTYKTKFLIIVFLINSIPFAIITETGKRIKNISEPFFVGRKSRNRIPTRKFTINKDQLFLKVLFTAMISIDLKMMEITDAIKRLAISQVYF